MHDLPSPEAAPCDFTDGANEAGFLPPVLTPTLLSEHLKEAQRCGASVWDILARDANVTDLAIARAFAELLDLPLVQSFEPNVRVNAGKFLAPALARRHDVVPLRLEDERFLIVAMANPADFDAIREIEFDSGYTVRPVVGLHGEILDVVEDEAVIDLVKGFSGFEDADLSDSEAQFEALAPGEAAHLAPVVRLFNLILDEAARHKASDLHIEPSAKCLLVRFRIDGVLRDYVKIPPWFKRPLLARVKVLARLDIAERRLPQDGRISAFLRGQPLDIRVSTLPTRFGEKGVLRLLHTSTLPDLEQLGFADRDLEPVRNALAEPQGLIVVTGPTGSGKTTTLYSMLAELKSPDVNIVTVEDPVEYQLDSVNQVQVHTKAGLTFPKCLRSILRQDPDVILIGEIRDAETCEIAIRAAMTGHLVLTTLHTNSLFSTIMRLRNLGIDPVLLTSTLSLVVAQRLVRLVCRGCSESYEPDPQILKRLGLRTVGTVFVRGRGCRACGNTGFAGRVAVFGLMQLDQKLKELIHENATEAQIRRAASGAGIHLLSEDAQEKLRLGLTSPDEVLRVLTSDQDPSSHCPRCDSRVHADFANCPYCRFVIQKQCESCGGDVQLDWAICAACATPIQSSAGDETGGLESPEVHEHDGRDRRRDDRRQNGGDRRNAGGDRRSP